MLDTYRNHGSGKNACISNSSCLSKYFVIFHWTMIVDMKSHYYAGHTFIIIWQYDWMLREGSLNNSVCWNNKFPLNRGHYMTPTQTMHHDFREFPQKSPYIGIVWSLPPQKIGCFWTWPQHVRHLPVALKTFPPAVGPGRWTRTWKHHSNTPTAEARREAVGSCIYTLD